MLGFLIKALKSFGLSLVFLAMIYFVLPIAVQLNVLSQKVDFVSEVCARPRCEVTAIMPSTGTNNGSITIQATVIDTVDTIVLRQTGQLDIVGTGMVPSPVSDANCNITFDLTDKTTGYWIVTPYIGLLAGADFGDGVNSGFLVKQALNQTSNVDNTAASTLTLTPDSGKIQIDIPAGTFGQTVNVSASAVSAPTSNNPTFKVGNVCIEITNDKSLQPDKEITITMHYRDEDIAGLDESKLTICRYDAVNDIWTSIPSTVDAVNNIITAKINHFSKFVLVQLAPSVNLASVKVYPNPLNTKLYSMTIAGLTASSDIKIYNVAGELVRKLDYSTGNGQTTWDGKNDSGSTVASGVYIVYIKSDSGSRKIKVAVEK